MTTVLDCSATLAWVFDDETNPVIDRIMADVTDFGAVAPGLWLSEVANGLQVAVRRKRIDGAYRDRALSRLALLDIRIDHECEVHVWSTTVRLAAQYGLTVYDACYLELAMRRRLSVTTLDLALAKACVAAGVTVRP